MSAETDRLIGFRRTRTWQTDIPGGWGLVGWRVWVGPLLFARTPGIRPGFIVAWTR